MGMVSVMGAQCGCDEKIGNLVREPRLRPQTFANTVAI